MEKNKVTIKTDENGKAKVDREKLPNGKHAVTDADGNEVSTVEVTDDCIVKLDFTVPSSDESVGGLLPSTATQVFNLLAIGLGILFAGLSIFFISRRGKEV